MTPTTKARLLSLCFAFTLFLLIMILGDYVLGLYTAPHFTTTIDSPLYEGHLLASQKVVTQIFNFENGTHTVRYTLTEGRYRYTPVENPELRDKFIAFFGCSLIFGTAVEDNQTIPAYIGKYKKDYMPYNFGKPGGALQHTYHQLIHQDLSEQIKEKKGVFIYLYPDFHFRRIIGGIPSPLMTVDSLCVMLENGSLVEKGTFRDVMPFRWYFYELLRHTNTLWYLNITFPLNAPQPEHWDLIASLFAKSATITKEKFPESKFIIAFWNASRDESEIMARIHTQGIPIECFDLDNAITKSGITLHRFPDGHFFPETNEALAKIILECISL